MITGTHQRYHRQVHGRLPACRRYRTDALFQRCDAFFQHRVGWIGQPRVNMAGAFDVEQTRGKVGVRKHERSTLINRYCTRAGSGIRDLAGLEIFTELRELDLGRNRIEFAFPIDQLGLLEVLDLSHNRLWDIFPLNALFNLREDPREKNNVIAQHGDVVRRMLVELAARDPWVVAPFVEDGSGDPDMSEALAALGYGGGDGETAPIEWTWICPQHGDHRADEPGQHDCGTKLIPVVK